VKQPFFRGLVKLKSLRKEPAAFRNGHLWVYAPISSTAPASSEAIVKVGNQETSLDSPCTGPKSRFALRLLSGEKQPPSRDLLLDRLRLSIERRGPACPEERAALYFGEADLLPLV